MSDQDVERLREDLRRERRRRAELERELATLRGALAEVKGDLERVAASAAWRWGHAVAVALARARGRPPRGEGAVRAALDRIARVEQALAWGLPSAAAPALLAPAHHAERLPQTRDPTALGADVRELLGPVRSAATSDLVSIVVVTRDGLQLMRRLVDGLELRTSYRPIELVVVDNGSTDGTRAWLAGDPTSFPLLVEVSDRNLPFAEACNLGAARARGRFLLFLNNDVEPIEPGWLDELLAAHHDGATAVGARLVHGEVTHPDASSGWIVQHRGIRFVEDGIGLVGRNVGDGDDALDETLDTVSVVPAATAACLLVAREAFDAVGGFDLRFRWGTEDVDLGLRLTRAGYEVRCTNRAVLLHRESSSQRAAGRAFMREHRAANRVAFARRWAAALRRETRLDRLADGGRWSEDPPTIAIAVSSAQPSDGRGDWLTARELGDALTGRGWRVAYVDGAGDRWYDLPPDVHYVLALIDRFDPRRLPHGVVAVAWIRNWTQRWLSRPWLDRYDLLLCSSRRSAALVRDATGREATLFPLATNPERFFPGDEPSLPTVDAVFTGNRWGEERMVERALPLLGRGRAVVYGRGWEGIEELRDGLAGPVAYEDLPGVYRSARVVIDDAAHHTRADQSVNARVFDALAAGTPVVSNGADGVRDLFDDEFPVWSTPQDLRAQVDALVAEPERAAALVERYRARVLAEHTWAHRADELVRALEDLERRLSFCVKIAAPSWEVAERWGDLHFARALARELRRRGHRTLIQVRSEWDDLEGLEYDVAVVLRGLGEHEPQPGQLNVLWCISHPDELSAAECDQVDLVFVASEPFAARLKRETRTPVVVLEQATDPRRFYPEPTQRLARDLVFVGNSRNVRRKVVDDLLALGHEVAIYGGGWGGLVDPRHVVAEHVPNEELRRVYSSATIVVSDHWDDMRRHGFVANRVYDALACGAVVLSDRVKGLDERFGGAVATYETRDELAAVVERLLGDPRERAERGRAGREQVLASHTFAHRVDVLLDAVERRIKELGRSTRVREVVDPRLS